MNPITRMTIRSLLTVLVLSIGAAVAAGGVHSLAIRSDGTLAGWGSNLEGQIDRTLTIGGFEALTAEALRELRAEKNAEISKLRTEKDAEIGELETRLERMEAMMSKLVETKTGGGQ